MVVISAVAPVQCLILQRRRSSEVVTVNHKSDSVYLLLAAEYSNLDSDRRHVAKCSVVNVKTSQSVRSQNLIRVEIKCTSVYV